MTKWIDHKIHNRFSSSFIIANFSTISLTQTMTAQQTKGTPTNWTSLLRNLFQQLIPFTCTIQGGQDEGLIVYSL